MKNEGYKSWTNDLMDEWMKEKWKNELTKWTNEHGRQEKIFGKANLWQTDKPSSRLTGEHDLLGI